MRPLPVLLLLGALSPSCAHPVKGEIDGDEVEIRSMFFVEAVETFSNGDGELEVWLTGVDDACAVMEDLYFDWAEAADVGDLADAWKAHMPEDFWSVVLDLRVQTPRADLSDQEFTGVPWNGSLSEDGNVAVEIIHYRDWLDDSYFDTSKTADAYLDVFSSDGGTLSIRSHEIDERISGVFEGDIMDSVNGSIEGNVTISFNAERCRGVEIFESSY